MPGTENSRGVLFGGSKFRPVVGKAGNRESSFVGVSITRSVHDNHFCSANPSFIAIVTESAGGGAFMVLPIHQTGRVPPWQPRVSGHGGRVLDVKWNPFNDHCVASCSEDCTVKIWDIPARGVQTELLKARKTLIGHCRRVGLIQWHPTAENLLLSSAYDYRVLLWDVSQGDDIIRRPVRVVLAPMQRRHPAEALLLSASFSEDGHRLAAASQDRRVRVLDPRTGRILQVSNTRSHKAHRVLYVGRRLLSTGRSAWNHRQMLLWDPEDLSSPLHEEDVDSSSGVLFPFYDSDTHTLFLAGKGDGNIRCYELSLEKPYIHFLTEFKSSLPQKGLAVMPNRGLDVSVGEIFRFYRVIGVNDTIEPLSVRDLRREACGGRRGFARFLLTTKGDPETSGPALKSRTLPGGDCTAVTAQEWLQGGDKEAPMMSLNPGVYVANPYPESSARPLRFQAQREKVDDVLEVEHFLVEQLSYQDAKYPGDVGELSGWQPDDTACCSEQPPPPRRADSELLQELHRQQEEIKALRAELGHRDVRIALLELKLNSSPS